MLQEFKTFIAKGNAMDLAIGVIIGAAFGKIVSSLVDDIFMPVIGLFFGKLDFSRLYVPLDGKHYESLEAAKAAGAATLNYGSFVTILIQFFLIAWVVFLMVKGLNALKRGQEEKKSAPPEPTAEEKLLGEIRDLLKQR